MDRMSDLAAKVTAELGGTVVAPLSATTKPVEELVTERIHVVTKGETLWGISRQYLGAGQRYTEIKALNGLTTNTIYPGQIIKVP